MRQYERIRVANSKQLERSSQAALFNCVSKDSERGSELGLSICLATIC
jgi:hypothetical protein